jgi:hypothetical protein
MISAKKFSLATLVLLNLTFLVSTVSAFPKFDYDGKADFGIYRYSEANWYSYSTESGMSTTTHWGSANDQIAPGDYDGDGITDFAIWRPGDGFWYIRRSTNGQPLIIKWGTSTNFTPTGYVSDIPVPGDYDHDGQTDIAVWRPTTGVWYVLKSTSGFSQSYPLIFQWGRLGDVPVQADYDNDDRTDFAVFRVSENKWYILQSFTNSWLVYTFGTAGRDWLVPADYTGDGKTDIAVYRPSEGTWYIQRSQDLQIQTFQFGSDSNDRPVPVDYDGDGHADIAIFRAGVWYIFESSTLHVRIFNYGVAGDEPINAFYAKISYAPIP